jgi:hypothetical protein
VKRVIGIDPGKGGGIAILGGESPEVHKMPETVGDLVDLLRSIAASGATLAYVERVSTSPQMGVVSAGTFMRGLGNIEAACQALGIRLEWVAPGVWQREMKCLTKGDKNVSKRRAQELFPTLKITHAIADALLIAEYGLRLQNFGRAAA